MSNKGEWIVVKNTPEKYDPQSATASRIVVLDDSYNAFQKFNDELKKSKEIGYKKETYSKCKIAKVEGLPKQYYTEKFDTVDKTIPTNIDKDYVIPKNNVIFDEEIQIKEQGIYINNRVRVIIQDLNTHYGITAFDYEYSGGWCALYQEIGKDKVKDIIDLINKDFIEGKFVDYGTSVATGKFPKDYEQDKDDIDISDNI